MLSGNAAYAVRAAAFNLKPETVSVVSADGVVWCDVMPLIKRSRQIVISPANGYMWGGNYNRERAQLASTAQATAAFRCGIIPDRPMIATVCQTGFIASAMAGGLPEQWPGFG